MTPYDFNLIFHLLYNCQMDKSFFITLSSKGQSIYTNTYSHFKVELDHALHFQDDLYEVALVDITLDADKYEKKEEGIVFITSNVCSEQLYNSSRLPLLRHLYVSRSRIQQFEFKHLYYMPVSNGTVNTIQIKILDEKRDLVSFLRQTSYCTLHFRRKR